MKALDLFAGPGGWSVACRELGIEELGIEFDKAVVATRDAAGFETVHASVTDFDAQDIRTLWGDRQLLIASPPCQSFSLAGKRKGLEDPRGQLVYEVRRYAMAYFPELIVCEQVPPVFPIWEEIAEDLEDVGYDTKVLLLQAEMFGVPQTRRRAVLIASRVGKLTVPQPTHSRYYPRNPGKLDLGVLPWVSMAEALDWSDDVEVISNYGSGGNASRRGIRHGYKPFATVTSKVNRNVCVTTAGAVRLTASEAGIVQGFAADFPWQGRETQQYQQVGNAIPPPLAEAIIRTALQSKEN